MCFIFIIPELISYKVLLVNPIFHLLSQYFVSSSSCSMIIMSSHLHNIFLYDLLFTLLEHHLVMSRYSTFRWNSLMKIWHQSRNILVQLSSWNKLDDLKQGMGVRMRLRGYTFCSSKREEWGFGDCDCVMQNIWQLGKEDFIVKDHCEACFPTITTQFTFSKKECASGLWSCTFQGDREID